MKIHFIAVVIAIATGFWFAAGAATMIEHNRNAQMAYLESIK